MVQSTEVPFGGDPIRSLLAGKPDFRELLELFVTEIAERRQQLEACASSRDLVQIGFRAHQLRGTGGGYGCPGLTAIATELEEACQAGDLRRVDETLHRTLGYMARITA